MRHHVVDRIAQRLTRLCGRELDGLPSRLQGCERASEAWAEIESALRALFAEVDAFMVGAGFDLDARGRAVIDARAEMIVDTARVRFFRGLERGLSFGESAVLALGPMRAALVAFDWEDEGPLS